MALGLLVLFAISGFLAIYIVTRVYFGMLFARTEMSLSKVFDRRVQDTKQLADAIETPTPAPDADADVPAELRDKETIARAAAADPVGAVAADRARVVAAILRLYAMVYGRETTDVNAAIKRLNGDGYLDERLSSLASSLLDLTRGAMRYEALSPAQARTVSDITAKFFRSLGRVASMNFEAQVERALRRLPDATVERRPSRYHVQGRSPDLLVTSDDRKIVVEAYLPHRELEKRLLEQRIRERSPFIAATGANGLLVVLPNGIDHRNLDADVPRPVAVMTLEEVEKAVADGSLLTDPRFES